MDQIDTMRAFAAVAQEGSFTGAGRLLGLSTKLVSNRVADLEGRLNTQLFSRTTRSVSITDTGTAYLERCRPILDQVNELNNLVQDRQTTLKGPIRMTAPTSFGATRLVEALASFQAMHPEVEIDLRLSDARVALVEEGIDLAVRIGVMRDSTLRVRKLTDMPLIVCASATYLADHGYPQDPGALAMHNCLTDQDTHASAGWPFAATDGGQSVQVSGSFRANSPAALAGMAVAGLGIARCPAYVIEDHLKSGALVALFEEYRAGGYGVFALYPPNRHLTARTRALINHLAQHFSRLWG